MPRIISSECIADASGSSGDRLGAALILEPSPEQRGCRREEDGRRGNRFFGLPTDALTDPIGSIAYPWPLPRRAMRSA